jgi:uncharacterized repeat protein (TIGR02543 family)
MKKTIPAVIMVMLAFALLVSCSDNAAAQKAEEKTEKETFTLYKVTFDADNGSDKVVIRVEENTTVPELKTPERTGYRFLGWYNGENKFDFSTKITGDITLTAKWEAKKSYTVKYDTMGGTTVANQIVFEGDKVSKPTDPTKKDYVFACWITEYGEEFNFDNILLSSDITLTATWNNDKVYNIGDTGPGGGVVFYVADEIQTSTYRENGKAVTYTWKYLESIKYSDDTVDWGPVGSVDTKREIGEGRSNTANMISTFTSSVANKVWGKDLKNNGYTDWFIPSMNEFIEIYRQKDKTGIGYYYYLTSSADTGSVQRSWYMDIVRDTILMKDVYRSTPWYLMVVRAF